MPVQTIRERWQDLYKTWQEAEGGGEKEAKRKLLDYQDAFGLADATAGSVAPERADAYAPLWPFFNIDKVARFQRRITEEKI